MTDDPNYDIAAQAGGLKISDIESKLGEMWAGQAGGPSPTATRVCTLNLVIVSHDGLDADTIMNATSVAAQQHPLRVLLLRSQLGGGETKPEGRVSGYCRMIKAGEIEVCCEQIVLTASGAHSGELAASAASLLVPDLPVALWWTGQPHFAGREFTRLMAISDHLIVDSRCFTDTAAGLTHLIACARDHKQVAVNDINWLRFAPWREQMADLFDEPAYRPLLFAVARMDIDYAAGAGSNPCQAVLLAGWLASRLKWSVVRCTEDSRGAYHAAVETADGDRSHSRREARARIAGRLGGGSDGVGWFGGRTATDWWRALGTRGFRTHHRRSAVHQSPPSGVSIARSTACCPGGPAGSRHRLSGVSVPFLRTRPPSLRRPRRESRNITGRG